MTTEKTILMEGSIDHQTQFEVASAPGNRFCVTTRSNDFSVHIYVDAGKGAQQSDRRETPFAAIHNAVDVGWNAVKSEKQERQRRALQSPGFVI